MTMNSQTEAFNEDLFPPPATTRTIKDPIHDFITFSPFIWAFIDTRQFQRLRAIKQLGVSYYVWAGAAHNRFEHCIGVAHLAGELVQRLKTMQPELHITERDVRCVQLAGLCHDLGHGPWSHVWDGHFIPAVLPPPDNMWTHEDASEMMFDDLVEQNGIEIDKDDMNFVKDLIKGTPHHSRLRNPPEKLFLFDIVANKRNGIDVDKFDYIARDVHAIGDHNNFSARRLIDSARVIDNEICYHIKDANQVYELCYWRFSNHKRIYSHKTARAIEYMIVDALKAAEPKMQIANQIKDPKKYVYLTDDIMPRIEMSNNPELAISRAIFDRVRVRDLYRCVDFKTFPYELKDRLRAEVTPERIVHAAKSLFASSGTSTPIPLSGGSQEGSESCPSPEIVDRLLKEHVIVDMAVMHHGMKERNPIDFVKFYGKHKPNKSFNAEPGDFSTLMPASFAEVLLRVYTREASYYGIIQAGYRAIIHALSENDTSPNQIARDPPTPPITEAPSTPRALSSQSSSRDASFGSTALAGVDATPRSTVRATPFTDNKFTKVSTTYVPPSPTQEHRRLKRRTAETVLDPGGIQTPSSSFASTIGCELPDDDMGASPRPRSGTSARRDQLAPRHPSTLDPSPMSPTPTRITRRGTGRKRDNDDEGAGSSTISTKRKKT